MIRHIVFFSLKHIADLEAVRTRLTRLGDIPGVGAFEVTSNIKVDKFDNSVDLVVYGEFVSVDALAAYKSHPTYAEVTAAVRPLRNARFAADIEAVGAVSREARPKAA